MWPCPMPSPGASDGGCNAIAVDRRSRVDAMRPVSGIANQSHLVVKRRLTTTNRLTKQLLKLASG